MTDILLREDVASIATLTLNDPGKLNALSDAMLAALKADADAALMEGLETEVLGKMGVSDPYAATAEAATNGSSL